VGLVVYLLSLSFAGCGGPECSQAGTCEALKDSGEKTGIEAGEQTGISPDEQTAVPDSWPNTDDTGNPGNTGVPDRTKVPDRTTPPRPLKPTFGFFKYFTANDYSGVLHGKGTWFEVGMLVRFWDKATGNAIKKVNPKDLTITHNGKNISYTMGKTAQIVVERAQQYRARIGLTVGLDLSALTTLAHVTMYKEALLELFCGSSRHPGLDKYQVFVKIYALMHTFRPEIHSSNEHFCASLSQRFKRRYRTVNLFFNESEKAIRSHKLEDAFRDPFSHWAGDRGAEIGGLPLLGEREIRIMITSGQHNANNRKPLSVSRLFSIGVGPNVDRTWLKAMSPLGYTVINTKSQLKAAIRKVLDAQYAKLQKELEQYTLVRYRPPNKVRDRFSFSLKWKGQGMNRESTVKPIQTSRLIWKIWGTPGYTAKQREFILSIKPTKKGKVFQLKDWKVQANHWLTNKNGELWTLKSASPNNTKVKFTPKFPGIRYKIGVGKYQGSVYYHLPQQKVKGTSTKKGQVKLLSKIRMCGKYIYAILGTTTRPPEQRLARKLPDASTWEIVSPESVFVQEWVCDKQDSNNLLIKNTANNKSLWLSSVNGGKQWKPFNKPKAVRLDSRVYGNTKVPSTVLSGNYVAHLEKNPHQEWILYSTKDHGKTWTNKKLRSSKYHCALIGRRRLILACKTDQHSPLWEELSKVEPKTLQITTLKLPKMKNQFLSVLDDRKSGVTYLGVEDRSGNGKGYISKWEGRHLTKLPMQFTSSGRKGSLFLSHTGGLYFVTVRDSGVLLSYARENDTQWKNKGLGGLGAFYKKDLKKRNFLITPTHVYVFFHEKCIQTARGAHPICQLSLRYPKMP